MKKTDQTKQKDHLHPSDLGQQASRDFQARPRKNTCNVLRQMKFQ